MGIKDMVLHIITGQTKQQHFLSQASRFYLSSLDGPKMTKMKMVVFFGRKLIISASILLRKSCLASKVGDLRSRDQSMSVLTVILLTDPTIYSSTTQTLSRFDLALV